MDVALSPDMQRFVEQKLQDGSYNSPDQVIEAGLASLQQLDKYGDFAPGELDQLLALGEADIAQGDVEDGEAFFTSLQELSDQRRRERNP